MSSGHLTHNIVLFGRLLRRLGLPVTPQQLHVVIEATAHVGIEQRQDFRDACRTLLAGRREHGPLFDRAFDLFWTKHAFKNRPALDLRRLLRRLTGQQPQALTLPTQRPDDGVGGPGDEDALWIDKRHSFSDAEVLRRKDFAELDDDERRLIQQMLRRQPWHLPRRRSRRRVAARRGTYLDIRRTLRRSLRTGGENLELAWRRRRWRPRPLVVLCDISGSMEAYARIFLQFIYTLRGSTEHLEAFVFATRLTRISRQLRHRDVDQALRQATEAIVDWGGGTRIGESFKRFNYDWGRRVLGRGAIVVVLSDAWDRGEVDLLVQETARLRRSCERLMWLNPLLGSPGYQPLTRGIRQVLPYIDDFMPVHNLASLEQLARTLGDLPLVSPPKAYGESFHA